MMQLVTDVDELRWPCAVVRKSDPMFSIAAQMFTKMKELDAQGLAANQVGWALQILVMCVQGRSPICLVNPVLFSAGKGSQESIERCLSLAGMSVRVRRPARVRVDGFNQFWSPVRYRFEGIDARRACHEVDHLKGKLITDYGEPVKDGNR